MLKCSQISAISAVRERSTIPWQSCATCLPPALLSIRRSMMMKGPYTSGWKRSLPPLYSQIFTVACCLPDWMKEESLVVVLTAAALQPRPTMQPASSADLPEPFLPKTKLTPGFKSTTKCEWFMKFTSSIFMIVPECASANSNSEKSADIAASIVPAPEVRCFLRAAGCESSVCCCACESDIEPSAMR